MAIATQINPEFYRVFSPAQVREIIAHLKRDRAIPFKFFYQGKLVEAWEALNVQQDQAPISSAKTDEAFLKRVCIHLFQTETGCDRWNLIDIGAGNPQLVRKLVGTFLENHCLNTYVALDISPDLLTLSETTLTTWFPTLPWRGQQWDFERDPMPEAIASYRQTPQAASNLYLYLGGTFCNVGDRIAVLKNIAAGMEPGEWLCISFSVDFRDAGPREFDPTHHISHQASQFILNSFGIHPDHAEIVGYFDPDWSGYKTDIRLQADYQLRVDYPDGEQDAIAFQAGDAINIYRFFSYGIEPDTSAPQILADFQTAGLEILSYRIEALLSRAMIVCCRTGAG
ncbi:L-histidine N(alpha)-methyltransferase [Spirulina major]|uniref:L-histidine N(alpha)-methyltransferase n=1 Tax=Spirulina major TaxID=270636 RepID=UPI00093277C9|nr:L-histidine N(alpha)-methyltransferase [Spirulina major]